MSGFSYMGFPVELPKSPATQTGDPFRRHDVVIDADTRPPRMRRQQAAMDAAAAVKQNRRSRKSARKAARKEARARQEAR